MRARQGSILLILAMLLPIAGCSGGAGSSAPPATAAGSASASRNSAAKSCSLLTQTETETAFGQAIHAPNGRDLPHLSRIDVFGLQVEIAHGPSIAATLDADKAKAGAGAADVAGVGEKAFEALQGRRLIEFMKNGSLVTLYSASRIDPDTFRGLARLAAGRLH